uniref:DUF2229 domain-containing protein n=1 Tax=Panagrellus redivivus TaxID=6233 RepID=A0A7E4VZ74_PANRE
MTDRQFEQLTCQPTLAIVFRRFTADWVIRFAELYPFFANVPCRYVQLPDVGRIFRQHLPKYHSPMISVLRTIRWMKSALAQGQ